MSKDSHSFSVSVACEVGVFGAILLQHLCFLQKANVSPGENWQEKWVRRSAASIAKTYPYWSAKQVSAICDNLEKQGYIFSRIQNATKIDRAKSYLLSSKGLHLMGEIPFAQMENGFSKKGNANAQMENDILPNGEMLIKVNCTSSLVPSFVENNAGAFAPLSPPFKKVDEIQSLEAEKENPTPPVPARPPAPTIVKLYDSELPGVVVVDSIPPQPMTKPETTGRQRQTRNTPHIHPENETCFSYFSDPAKARAAWQEWIDYKYEQHRERYKAAKSELSKLRQLFKQFSGDSEKFEVAVNYSIGNLYKGVFPPKQEKENGQIQHDKAQQQHLKLARFVADLRNGYAFADTRKVEYITGEKPL